MTLIAEFRIVADDFVLARTMENHPELCLEFERFIPTDPFETMSYLWVGASGLDPRTAQEILASDPTADDVRLVDDLDGGALFQVQWEDVARAAITEAFTNGDETLVQAVGEAEEWFLKIRFDERESLSGFQSYCNENDIAFDVLRLYDVKAPKLSQYDLTTAQRDAIIAALELGYFGVPRNCELSDVADELDLSVNAVSERIRRGEANLFRSALMIPRPPHRTTSL